MAGCQVCFESYEENGEHLPRILPCAGLICEKCIKELLDGSHIDCPECGSRHPAKKGVQSFPQTVLPRSKKKPGNVEKNTDNSRCKKHGKDPCINCKEPFCSKAVISFLQNHCKVKEEADAEEEEFETLFSELEDVTRNLRSYKTKILVTKGKLERKQTTCINKMKNRRKEIKKILPRRAKIATILEKSFNEPMKVITDQMAKINSDVDKEITAIDKKLVLLEGIKEITDVTATHDDIQSSLNITTRIAENLRVYWAEEKTFNYLEYTTGQSSLLGLNISAAEEIKRLCGHLNQKQMHVKFSIEDDNDSSSEALSDAETEIVQGSNGSQARQSLSTPPICSKDIAHNDLIKIESDEEWTIEVNGAGKIELLGPVEILSDDESAVEEETPVKGQPPSPTEKGSTSEVAAEKEVSTVGTAHTHIAFMCALSDRSIIICGKDDDRWTLTKYRAQDFKTLSSAALAKLPDGMTEVTFAEQHCLAVSYMDQKKIEFHEVADLGKVVNTYGMTCGVPGRLCTLSSFPFILLYEDRSNNLCEVKWLECSTNPPKPATDTDIIHTQQEIIWDMCCAQNGDKQLLVTTRGKNGVSAYNIDSDQLQWSIDGKLIGNESDVNAWGVATDGRGHLFICDYDNGCVQKFSSSGTLIGTVIKKGDNGLGQPWSVVYTSGSSLIVAHVLDGQYYITRTYDNLEDAEIFPDDARNDPSQPMQFDNEDDLDDFADAILAANLESDNDGARVEIKRRNQNPPEVQTPAQFQVDKRQSDSPAVFPLITNDQELDERPKNGEEAQKHKMVPVIRKYDVDMRTPQRGTPPLTQAPTPNEPTRPDELTHESPEALPELVGYGTEDSPGPTEDESFTENAGKDAENLNGNQPSAPESQPQFQVSAPEAHFRESHERNNNNNNNEKWIQNGQGHEVSLLQGHEVPRQGHEVSLQGHEVPRQGREVSLQGHEVPRQGHEVSLQGHEVPLQVPAPVQNLPMTVQANFEHEQQFSRNLPLTAPISFGMEEHPSRNLEAQNSQHATNLFDISAIPLPPQIPKIPTPEPFNNWPNQMQGNANNGRQDIRIQNSAVSSHEISPMVAAHRMDGKNDAQMVIAQRQFAISDILPAEPPPPGTTPDIEAHPDNTPNIIDSPVIKELTFVNYLSVLADGSVVVSGKERGGREAWRMIRFNSQLDRVFTSTTLRKPPDGLTDIKLGGKHCIAVAHTNNKEIDFHDVNNLNQIVLNFPVAPHRPSRLCQSSLSTLLYVDNSEVTREVRWLDCSTQPPKLAIITDGAAMTPRPKITRITLHADTYGTCCALNGDSQYLITTHGRKGVSAYDTTKDRLDWSIARTLPDMDKEINASSVTSDAQGNLFVCDANNSCVHLFSIDGLYQGTFLKEGDQGLGEPGRIHWCNRTSSVVTVHMQGEQCRIRKMSATPEYLKRIQERTVQILKDLGASGDGPSFPTMVHGCIAPINVKVTDTITTQHSHIFFVTPLSDGTILFCGKNGNQWRLIQYDMEQDMELAQTPLEKRPDGITQVSVDGMNCLAISYLLSKVIHFYDLDNIQDVLHSYSVAPNRPGRLCTYLSNTILYEDHSQTPHIVRSLDCRTTNIVPTTDSEFTNLELESGVHDMCCVEKGKRSYFVSTNGYKGVFNTNNETDELDWNVKGKLIGMKKDASLWGVTSDGRGHLLLCDTENKCVQMLSLTDGRYMGDVLREGEQGLGQPWRIHCCTKTATCFVVHKKGQDWCISMMEVSTKGTRQEHETDLSEEEMDMESTHEDMEENEDSEEESPIKVEREDEVTLDSDAEKELSDVEDNVTQREEEEKREESFAVKRIAPWQKRKLDFNSGTSPENVSMRRRQPSETEASAVTQPVQVPDGTNTSAHRAMWLTPPPQAVAQPVAPAMNESVGARLLRISQSSLPVIPGAGTVVPPNELSTGTDPWRSPNIAGKPWEKNRQNSESNQKSPREGSPLEDPWKKVSDSNDMEDFERRQPMKKAHSVPAPWEGRKKDQPRSVSVPESPEKRPWTKQNSAPGSESSTGVKSIFDLGPDDFGKAQPHKSDGNLSDAQQSLMSPVRQSSEKWPWRKSKSRWSDGPGVETGGKDRERTSSESSTAESGSRHEVAPMPAQTLVFQSENVSNPGYQTESPMVKSPEQIPGRPPLHPVTMTTENQPLTVPAPVFKSRWSQNSSDEDSSSISPTKNLAAHSDSSTKSDTPVSKSSQISQRWRREAFKFKFSKAASPPKLLKESEWQQEESNSDSESAPKETTFKRLKKWKENTRKVNRCRDKSQDSDSDTDEDTGSRLKSLVQRRNDKFKSPSKKQRTEEDEKGRDPAADFIFKEKETISTQHENVAHMCLLTDGTIVVNLNERGASFLVMYDNKTGKQVASQKLKSVCDGLTEVTLGGESCLAVSNTAQKKIYFYDAHRMNLMHQYPVDPYRPMLMCTSGSSMLVFVDKLQVVRWMDCSEKAPRLLSKEQFTLMQHEALTDICCLKYKDVELFVTADKVHGIIAYDLKSNKREWSIKGAMSDSDKSINPLRLTTDGNGHLFVIDKANESIRMFSSDTVHMGIVPVDTFFKNLKEIAWCKKTSSVIAIHKPGRHCRIAKVQSIIENVEDSPRKSPIRRRMSEISEKSGRSSGDDRSRSPSSRSRITIDSDSDAPSVKKGRWDDSTKKRDHSELGLKVADTINTEFSRISFVSPGGRDKKVVFVYGRLVGEESWKLVRFSTRDREAMEAVKLKDAPQGMVEVDFNGKPCIALSYKVGKKIHFHDANDLKAKAHVYSVDPHIPGPMCKVNDSTILYADHSQKSCRVQWLDCAKSVPQPSSGKSSIMFGEDTIIDMCFAQHKDQDLVLVLLDYEGIYAYEVNKQNFVWRIDGKLSGMRKDLRGESLTTDGNGNLFVSDYKNRCVHHFSLDGVYIKPVIKGESDSLSEPLQVRWCSRICALIIAHMKRRHYGISIIEKSDSAGEHYKEKDTHLLLPFSES